MNKNGYTILILCAALILSLCGCEKLAEISPIPIPTSGSKKSFSVSVQGTIIAKVNDMPITLEQMEEEIKNYNQLVGVPEAQITTRDQKIAYLNEELIRRYLFYQEAKTRGLDKEAKTQELLRNLQINILANQLVQKEIDNLLVTSSEIEDFYNLYKEQYKQEEERRIREIVVDTEDEAKDALIKLLKGADFANLAIELSRAQSSSVGGDLGFIRKGQRGVDFIRFDEVAFSPSLQAGQISNIFKNKDQYYIVKVEERRGGQPKSLSEVWEEIKRNVLFLKQQQKVQELSNMLLKDAKVVIYKERIQ